MSAARKKVLLTADRTLMSDYRHNEFLGFGSTAPPNLIPDWLFMRLFFPPVKTREGIPLEAPYGLRKIESQLIGEGFDVLTVDPDHLNRYLEEAKVLGVHVMDPFGIGPSSSTFTRILNTGEPYLAKYFQMLLEKPEVRRAKKRGLKIIVGGPGTWQFRYRPEFLNEHGIDCAVNGEAEKVVGKIFERALKGEEIPQFYDVNVKDAPSVQEIPDIRNPSVNGLVEVGRGCCRGCKFCSVTLRPLRWYPYEKIEREIIVNVEAGVNRGLLHAEDVLLYGSKNVIPDRDRVLKLHKSCKRLLRNIGWSHASMSAVAADPKLVEEVSEVLLDEDQEWWGAEMGIETGAPNLIKKAMPSKALPFKPEDWPEVVKTAAGIMTDSSLVPACTLIMGLPQETEEDVIKSIELIEDLKGFKSLIVPLFFVPMGQLRDEDWFTTEQMNDLQRELLVKCLKHDVYWAKIIMRSYFDTWYGPLASSIYRFFVWLVERKAKEEKIDLEMA
jgi:radical SAM superfamily enzyme YgiQ (UPF0313 family)